MFALCLQLIINLQKKALRPSGAGAGRGRGVGGAWVAGGSRQHLLPTMEMTLPKRDVGSQKIMSKKGKNGKRKKMKEDSL